jgi:hypothetical protein
MRRDTLAEQIAIAKLQAVKKLIQKGDPKRLQNMRRSSTRSVSS